MLEKNTFNQGFFFAEKTLFAQVENINKINVFPVADNDTGTNLYHSIDSIYRIIPSNISIKKQLALFSDQLFEKASGNSGFILSMLFNEIASNWPEEHINTPSDVGQVLFLSAQNTKLKITDYVKGGMISYVKTLANFLILMGNKLWSLSLYEELETKNAFFLQEIAKHNPSLIKHKVVDAGALGLSYWFIGLLSALCLPNIRQKNTQHLKTNTPQKASCDHPISEEKPIFKYCTQATLTLQSDKKAQIKALISAAGDCDLQLFQSNKMRFHVHSNKPQALFSELMQHSIVSDAKVDDMLSQFTVLQKKQEIAIVTDSSADIPTHLLETYPIHVIPMTITHKKQKMLDGLTISTEALLAMSKTSSQAPKTSTPPIGTVKKMFEFLSQNHKHVFAISISKNMSGTFKVLSNVAKSYNNISVINSRRNSGAHGSIVTAIAKLAHAGNSHETIKEKIDDLIDSTDIFVLVDNFKTMRKSGRITQSKAFIADMIHLKPLIGVDTQGRGVLLAKHFSRRGQEKSLLNLLQTRHLKIPIKAFKVLHVDCLEEAKTLQALMAEIYPHIPCELMHASASISLHAGKGTLAVSTE